MFSNSFRHNSPRLEKIEKSFLLRLVTCGIGVLILILLYILLQFSKPSSISQQLYNWASLTLTTPILYFTAWPLINTAFLRRPWHFTIDLPILWCISFSYLYSIYATLLFNGGQHAYFDSILMVLFILYTCRYFEVFFRHTIDKQVENLSFHFEKLLINENEFNLLDKLAIGDKISIAPGKIFPVDGLIIQGKTTVDESLLAGESLLNKTVNDKVHAGSYNLTDEVVITITTPFNESQFGKVVTTIHQGTRKNSFESSGSEQIALWQQMTILTLAAAIYCWWLPFDNQFALYCALSVLLVTCPGPLAIIPSLTISFALAICAKKGVLIKNPSAFLKLATASHLLLDKTGTLTEGNLVVSKVEYFNDAKAELVLPLIARVEQHSLHPIAHAIVSYAQQLFPASPHYSVTRLRIFPGKGLRALIDGKFILIGSAYWLRKNGVFIPTEVVVAEENNADNEQVLIHYAIGGVEVARIHLKDIIRQDAAEVIGFLSKTNIQLHLLNNDVTASDPFISLRRPSLYEAECQYKETEVITLQDQGFIPAVVGDSLNDCLALKRAEIGIAIGSGSPLALTCADIILKRPELKLLKTCLIYSFRCQQILKQNYLLALLMNLTLLPFAAMGFLSPLMILLSLALSSLLIVANTLRIHYIPITFGNAR